jgi:hypothetical protein
LNYDKSPYSEDDGKKYVRVGDIHPMSSQVMPDIKQDRVSILVDMIEAEEKALSESDGLLACSPELWELMNTAFVVLRQVYSGPNSFKTHVDSIHWNETKAKDAVVALQARGDVVYYESAVFGSEATK